MAAPLATYSFLPWLRQGIANTIAAVDLDANVKLRATIRVELALTGEGGESGLLTAPPIDRNVHLYGPGDVVGIEGRAVIKVEPRNWITNFEPNYLPYVDFYDEDFPWRYTPAAPDGTKTRLRPWIMLALLKEGEFEEAANLKDKPLPFIKVSNPGVFPPADQLWAWAHVHVNRSLAGKIIETDMNSVLSGLQVTLTENPDLAYSRILCPRKLEANASYHAFLIPVFESGRLAGLGLDSSKAPYATFSAWNTTYPNSDPPDPAITRLESDHYPYYYRWYFRTGTVGDFEYLVRLLQPKPVDKRVGRRDLDVQAPGLNLPGINDLGGILKLGGALQVPEKNYTTDELAEVKRYENWSQDSYPHPFQKALATLVNLADEYATKAAPKAHQDANEAGVVVETGADPEGGESPDPDPVITPPLYGRWHAPAQRLLNERDDAPILPNNNWVHELNLDPRFRVAAGFGTKVIQERQEEYMNAAWEQIGDVLEASRRIRAAQLAREVSWIWYERHLHPLLLAKEGKKFLLTEKAFLLMAPIQKRVTNKGATVYHNLKASALQPGALSAPMRRITRPRGRLMRALPFAGQIQPQNLLERVNAGDASAAPAKKTPPGVVTVNQLADDLSPKDVPRQIQELLRRRPWFKYAPLAAALLIALLCGWLTSGVAWSVGLALIAGLAVLYRQLGRWSDQIRQAESLREENQRPEVVDRLPYSPDFVVSEPGAGVTPRAGSKDSPEAARFKSALKDLFTVRVSSTQAAERPAKTKLEDLPALTKVMFEAIDPDVIIPKRTWQSLILPARIKGEIGERLIEPMGHPEFDTPMYQPLADISSELFLPNINFVEPNSITILETNQKFIESYLLGLNHEFARELLWREYPTDQRGSYFRQFWDVSAYLDTENIPKDDLRDIPPLHKWPRDSNLGSHDHREAARRRRQPTEGGDKDKKEVVLVIRGELLKKYPTAVVYAHKAEWPLKADGAIDTAKERRLVRLEGVEEDQPPRTKVKTPLYEAKVEPDIYFFGFDLTVEEAQGGTGENEGDKEKPGWFFVIKERPGEPRFGLDLDQSDQLNIWNDLSWEDILPGAPGGAFIQINSSFTLQAPAPSAEAEAAARQQQHAEDKQVRWDANTNSADLAYILYQAPVLVAVHGAEMLPKP